MTGVGGRDSGHSHCGEWWPGAVRPGRCGGVVGINASVRRAGEWKGRLSLPSRGWPRARRRRSAFSRAGSLPSSEAEARGAVEGFGGEPWSEAEIIPRVRRGVRMARTAYVGRVLDFFESFPFFQIGRRP